MKRFFITGTDTNCGKTFVTCSLLQLLNQRPGRAIGLKPIATGCLEQDGQLFSEDAVLIQKNNSNKNMEINKWKFKTPVSPHIAAKETDTLVTISDLLNFCSLASFQQHDFMFIEGAGGLMVPFNERDTWIDFLSETAMSVIVVVGMRLGCINHALLTAKVLRLHGITCVGWIANCVDEHMLCLQENISTLQEKMPMPYLATISHGGGLMDLDSRHLVSQVFLDTMGL